MNDHDIQLLAIGSCIGSYLTLLSWMVLDRASGRRSRAAAKCADLRTTDRDKHTEPHPAETAQALARDIELELRDGIDRVEGTLRRDGLL